MPTHVPCDIALVIDVSGSMGCDAPVPGETTEKTGLSVLDLVKHACRTILSTMDERDRLAIVTFSTRSKVLQPLLSMTAENKKDAHIAIDNMKLEGCTNLWHGLRDGIRLFQDEEHSGRVPAIMVLTDGAPNHMCPAQGYVPALSAMPNIVPSIHTFGFGYSLRSGLLKSIAEFGHGNYSFIPDAGMIGTVFVHAVANLQSTFANEATLSLVYPDHVTLQQSTGPSVGQQEPVQLGSGNYRLTIPLGSLQYGQSRDIYLRWTDSSPENDNELAPPYINATLEYSRMTATRFRTKASRSLLDISTSLSAAEIAYHISRSLICAFLAHLFPIDSLGEHRLHPDLKVGYQQTLAPGLEDKKKALEKFIASLPAADFPQDTRCTSLLQDLTGPEPLGQISLALSRQDYLNRWGQHYLPSLHGAHARQLCNSFKDVGPLHYGVHSPLFIQCRDRLNTAFDDLPPPVPSNPVTTTTTTNNTTGKTGTGNNNPNSGTMMDLRNDPLYRIRGPPIAMRAYNSSSNPCFAGPTRVKLADGTHIPLSELTADVKVATPVGPRAVAAVLVTPVAEEAMVDLQGVLVTPWHPVALLQSGEPADAGWVHPCELLLPPQDIQSSSTKTTTTTYTGRIYSVLLQADDNVDAHALILSGPDGVDGNETPFLGVTLGHGMVTGSDKRAHGFFGDRNLVVRSLDVLRTEKGGRFISGGVKRSETTGLVCGFNQS